MRACLEKGHAVGEVLPPEALPFGLMLRVFVQMVLWILSNSAAHFCGFRAHRSREVDDHRVWGGNHGLGSSDGRSQTRGLLPDLTVKTV